MFHQGQCPKKQIISHKSWLTVTAKVIRDQQQKQQSSVQSKASWSWTLYILRLRHHQPQLWTEPAKCHHRQEQLPTETREHTKLEHQAVNTDLTNKTFVLQGRKNSWRKQKNLSTCSTAGPSCSGRASCAAALSFHRDPQQMGETIRGLQLPHTLSYSWNYMAVPSSLNCFHKSANMRTFNCLCTLFVRATVFYHLAPNF